MNFDNFDLKNQTSLNGMLVVLLLLLFLSQTTVFALPSGFDIKQPIYAFEFLSFRAGQGGKTLLEIFCQIPTEDIQFIKFKDGFFGSYELSITLYDLLNNQIACKSFIDSVKVKTFYDIDRPRAPRLIRSSFLVEPGKYEARICLTDLETLRSVDLKKENIVPDYETPGLKLSDLQIATSITAANENNILEKNGWEVIPNVPRIIGPKSNILCVYSELYNLHYIAGETNKEFMTTFTIINDKGVEVKSLTFKRKKPGDTCTLSVRIPVHDLDEGLYQLNLIVEDLDNAQTVRKSTNFYVVKPNPEREITFHKR